MLAAADMFAMMSEWEQGREARGIVRLRLFSSRPLFLLSSPEPQNERTVMQLAAAHFNKPKADPKDTKIFWDTLAYLFSRDPNTNPTVFFQFLGGQQTGTTRLIQESERTLSEAASLSESARRRTITLAKLLLDVESFLSL